MSLTELTAAVRAGDSRAVARALSAVERGDAAARELLAVLGGAPRPWVVGITGPPGAGKSTLAETLGLELLKHEHRLAVLAVDPSSPFSGGALLGDRVRMGRLASAPGAFIRSMATRGALGGLAGATADAVDVLSAAGFPLVLIETVGVGQDEVEVMHVADTVLLATPPGLGDEIQAAKAGVLEIAHVLAVTKADLPGADRVEAQLQSAVELGPAEGWRPPVVRVSALTGDGMPNLMQALRAHRQELEASGRRAMELVSRARRRVDLLASRLSLERIGEASREAAAGRVAAGDVDPYTVAMELVEALEPAAGVAVDHIGVAVPSLDDGLRLYRRLGLELAGVEEVPEQGVRVAFLPAGETRIELLEPLNDGSPIARHLARRGPGLHHVALSVPDIRAAMAELREAGFELLSDEPQPGAHGCLICFVHPRSAGGVLLELTQPSGGDTP